MLSRLLLETFTAGQWLKRSTPAVLGVLNCSSLAPDPRKWEFLVNKGLRINPCNSMLHPAVIDAGILPDAGDELCVQHAYTPEGKCFGCGPIHPDGLGLQSRRIPHGLIASIAFEQKFQAFPGIIQGGIVASAFECHGNWTAAIHLMDMSCLPRPPLTLTASIMIDYKQPTPPDELLTLKSQVVRVKELTGIGMSKQSVEVEIFLFKQERGSEQLYVSATGIFKRRGPARSL